MTDARELLRLHDEQVRGTVADRLPDNWAPSWDGPVLRVATPARGIVFGQHLDGVPGDELDALIARAVEFFAAKGLPFEWKTYGHDRPDLPERLEAAGFASAPAETVVVGFAADLVDAGVAPDGVRIRATTAPDDLRRIADLQSEVWGSDWSWLADDLAARIASGPDDIVVLVAEAGATVVSTAWLVVLPGTEFASLWGGSTLFGLRGRGIYRALVAQRARIAVERGIRYLWVDASDDSAPILQRLGLRAVTTTTPWLWTP
ncbi:GNAT family N-acetyltransferase [Dactylosporangium sp. NPDC048998]|uniref:GNAT family N-acetyltransferase n=1 Tax=Dactylosporangium sp. NPDC048998 TaxID=3363976 RepID=UPI0037159573